MLETAKKAVDIQISNLIKNNELESSKMNSEQQNFLRGYLKGLIEGVKYIPPITQSSLLRTEIGLVNVP